MTTDIERELRELFRDKAGEAPVATPTAAPQQVLRRGRRRQVGTALGSAAVALILVVGSVAGLQRLLRDDSQVFGAGYEVFERTATVEAFTVTSPSNWFLVNRWPLSTQIAVGSGSASETCTVVPGAEDVCEPGTQSSTQRKPPPYGLPMLQLTNVDMSLRSVACGADLPAGAAVLYVALDYERAIVGAKDPSIEPFPPEPGLPPQGDGPCGTGSYARFTVNGEPFFAWVGFGSGVSDDDRATVTRAYEMMSADETWEPTEPEHVAPAYVIAGGVTDPGEDWRLELRPGNTNVELSLEGVDPGGSASDFTVPAVPIESCCEYEEGFTSVAFGAVAREAEGVALQPSGGSTALEGTIVPLPPSMPYDFDLFFIEGTGGLNGEVVALGPDVEQTQEPAPPVAEPRGDEVQLSGSMLGHEWGVRFTGTFADETACIGLAIGTAQQPALCPKQLETSLTGAQPSMHVWVTHDLTLFAGSVPPEVVEIRFTSDDGTNPPTQFQCQMGPLGWTDPDKKVCVLAFPPEGSGTFRYLDADGNVLFEEGSGWASATSAAVAPADLVHGGTYWAVYPWVGAAGSPEAEDVSAQLLEEFGIEAGPGDLGCDQGAADALGTNAEQGIAVYFEAEEDANAFALEAGLLGHQADPVIARVTTYCLD